MTFNHLSKYTATRLLLVLFLIAPTTSLKALPNKFINYLHANQANIMGQLKTAGSTFVGGNLDVFGDELIEGNSLILGNELVIGNLIVEGIITNTSSQCLGSITITGDTGGPLTGNNFIFTGGTTGLTFNGSGGNTETLGGTLAVANGGTGATTLTGVLIGHGTSAVTGNPITQFDVLVGGASNAINSVAPGAAGIPLISNGAAANPVFGTATVPGGGTGQITLAANQLLAGNGTLAIQSVSNGTAGQVLTSNGAGVLPSFQAGGGCSITITGDTGGPLTSGSFVFTGGTTGLTFNGAGTTETLGGTLAVANGGTGATTLTGVLIGHGTSAVTGNPITQFDVLVGGASNAINSVAPGATGIPLVSNGVAANPSFTTATVPGGGTGAMSFTPYAVLTGGTTSTNQIQSIASVGTAGQVLTSNGAGALPSFQSGGGGSITLNGDTGSASGTTITVTSGQSTQNSGSTVSFSGAGSTLTFNVSSGNNTLIGLNAGTGAVSGTNNTAVGFNALTNLTSAGGNTAFGSNALASLTTGVGRNDAFGSNALASLTTGAQNDAFGADALANLTTGIENCAFGSSALTNLVTGDMNTAFGFNAGTAYTGAETNNICIGQGVTGTLGESNVIRIGNGSTACFIQGISGVTTGGVATAVLVDASGQLGTISSSRRYKNSIVDMNDQSSPILALRPVTFCYNSDAHNRRQYGLIAEEVLDIMPDLVVHNNNDEVESVRYHDLAILLLNELQKEHAALQIALQRIEVLESQLSNR